jgi:hypothetical protein
MLQYDFYGWLDLTLLIALGNYEKNPWETKHNHGKASPTIETVSGFFLLHYFMPPKSKDTLT